MSFARPTAAGIATPQGLLAILVGLYEKIDKPGGGNLTQFIKPVINETVTSGGAGGVLATLASSAQISDTSGAEWASPDLTFPLLITSAKPTLTFSAALYTASSADTAQFWLRVGGVLGAGGTVSPDGVVVGASAQASSGFTKQEISGTIPNPGGIVLGTLTMKTSAPGASASVCGLQVTVS